MFKLLYFVTVSTVFVISPNNFCLCCSKINQTETKLFSLKNITTLLKNVFETYFTETEISIVSFSSKNHHYNAFKNEITTQLFQDSNFTLTKYKIGHSFSTKSITKLPNSIIVFVDVINNIKTEFLLLLITKTQQAPKIILIINYPNSTKCLTTKNQQLNKLNHVLIVNQLPKSYDIISWQPNNRCNHSFLKIATITNNQLTKYATPLEHYRKCPIIVKAELWRPFTAETVANNSLSRPNTYFESFGIEIDLYNVLAKQLNVTFRFFMNERLDDYGILYPNGTVTHTLLELYRHEIDIAGGAYTLLENSLSHFDIVDYFYDANHFCVPFTQTKRNLHLLGASNVYGIVALFVLLLTLLLWLEAKRQPIEVRYHKFWNVFITTFSITFGFGAGLRAKSGRVRIIFGWMLLTSFIMVTCYQAIITKVLTTETQPKPAIVDIQGIIAAGLTFYAGDTYKSYFSDTPELLKNWKHCNDARLCIIEIAEEKSACIALAATDVMYRMSSLIVNKEIYCFSESHSPQVNVLYVGKNFGLLEEFKAVVLRMREAGLFLKWLQYFAAHPMIYNRTFVDNDDIFMDLNLGEMEEAFWLWMVGCLAGAVVFVVEIVYFRKWSDCNVNTDH